jgi:DNA modification methylase
MAARSLGWSHVDACLVDVDDETAKSIVAADNKLADLGGYDDLALFSLLDSLEDLGATGYKISELEALRQDLFPPEVLTDPDEAPSVPAEPVSVLGQIWQLGKHRLLVGDSTDVESVRRLVGDEPPNCVWTDPPYGVDYVGGTKEALTIQNDGTGGLKNLLLSAFEVLREVCSPGAPIYVAHADATRVEFETAMRETGLLVRQNLIWVKSALVLGRFDYHYKHEPILYGFVPAPSGTLGRGGGAGGERWFGDHSQTSVFEFDKPPRNAEHPTMKPVALIDAMLKNSLAPGGIVFDPFGGSGSTLIAAHDRGCRAFCVELDPRYADVILTRFQRHTGVVPVCEGEQVSFVETEE